MFSIFGRKITEKQILIAIILLGVALRFWTLGSTEFFHDEGFKVFRSIGYLDYLQNDDQTTPIQWFADAPALPWWTNLSFHDHPPLFFLIQGLFLKIFGTSLWAARLPSAIAGAIAIYLIYLLTKNFLVNPASRLFAAALFSFSLLQVWISRSSLMEATQILFILLNIYWFFRMVHHSVLNEQRKSKDYLWFGFTLGLCFLVKYTSAFLLPVYGLYILLFHRDFLRRKELYWALGLAAVLFSPVLIFNFYLYQTVGHFDLQFSYLFRQATPEWRVSLGKIQDPFSEILDNLSFVFSIPFLLLSVLGIGYAARQSLKHRLALFWLLNIIFITLMLAAVGSGFRFIVLYVAPAVMLVAFLADQLFPSFLKRNYLLAFMVIFAVYEFYFATDIFRTFPDFGVVKLDNYLNETLGDKRSRDIPASPNIHLNQIIKDWASRIPADNKSKIVVYDSNIGLSPRLWLFTRRNYYLGVPTFNVDQFKNFLDKGGAEHFRGYDIYFVRAAKNTILNPLFHNNSAAELELYLNRQNILPMKVIHGYSGLLMFSVYKFSI